MTPEPEPRRSATGEPLDDDAELLRRIEIVLDELRQQ